MTISLPGEIESRLKQQASRLGLDPAEYAGQLIVKHLPLQVGSGSLADLFAEWDSQDATDDPNEIARRNQDFEELKNAMNRSRTQMEGSGARKLWP